MVEPQQTSSTSTHTDAAAPSFPDDNTSPDSTTPNDTVGSSLSSQRTDASDGTSDTNQSAIIAFAASIIWFFGLGSLAALFYGTKARSEIAASRGTQTGEGLATAGIFLGWIGVGITVLLLIAWATGYPN
ncbi:MAG: DUF4190 domain-containing protein [Actinobacteria bacterium]|nr:DUF4190 domain-containing protein [Actinomycetota bacterium]MCB9389230.1 DUF4190 domain-containing protein [Acidimicrobiia bacterium]